MSFVNLEVSRYIVRFENFKNSSLVMDILEIFWSFYNSRGVILSILGV